MRIPVLLRFLQLDVGLLMLRPVNGYGVRYANWHSIVPKRAQPEPNRVASAHYNTA